MTIHPIYRLKKKGRITCWHDHFFYQHHASPSNRHRFLLLLPLPQSNHPLFRPKIENTNKKTVFSIWVICANHVVIDRVTLLPFVEDKETPPASHWTALPTSQIWKNFNVMKIGVQLVFSGFLLRLVLFSSYSLHSAQPIRFVG